MLSRLLVAILLVASCGGASADPGIVAALRLDNAQYVEGEIDAEETDQGSGPVVHTVSMLNSSFLPGTSGHALSGTLGPGSTAVLIGLRGDVGHWILPVSTANQATPGDFDFSTKVSFSPELPPPPFDVLFRATNRQRQAGPATVLTLSHASVIADGAMVIALDWDAQADLDLHVQLPSAGADGGLREISTRKRTSLLPPVPGDPPATPEQAQGSAYLDVDSNAQCLMDGRRNENVIWPVAPEPGTYVVRVDTFSMCGEVVANWRVRVFIDGVEQPSLGRTGQSMDVDTRFPHGTGAGIEVVAYEYR